MAIVVSIWFTFQMKKKRTRMMNEYVFMYEWHRYYDYHCCSRRWHHLCRDHSIFQKHITLGVRFSSQCEVHTHTQFRSSFSLHTIDIWCWAAFKSSKAWTIKLSQPHSIVHQCYCIILQMNKRNKLHCSIWRRTTNLFSHATVTTTRFQSVQIKALYV